MILNDQKEKLEKIVGNLKIIADCLWRRKFTQRTRTKERGKPKTWGLFKSSTL